MRGKSILSSRKLPLNPPIITLGFVDLLPNTLVTLNPPEIEKSEIKFSFPELIFIISFSKTLIERPGLILTFLLIISILDELEPINETSAFLALTSNIGPLRKISKTASSALFPTSLLTIFIAF